MELKGYEMEALKSIDGKLSNYCVPTRLSFIYKVHDFYIRDINDNVCEPTLVAVGPYHRGKQGLKMIEEHKLRYLKSLLERKTEKVDRYISAAAEMEQEARNCYAEDVSLSAAEFIEMLVLDGCYIIELLAKFHSSYSFSDAVAADPIFQMKWILDIIKYDLILFENQIPFFVLCKLFDLINEEPNQHWRLIEPFLAFYELDELYRSKGMNIEVENVKHLLHLVHAICRPSSADPVLVDIIGRPPEIEFLPIPTATELKDANVTFRKREREQDRNPFEAEFKNGVLTMAPMTFEDGTDRLFRNLILYERYSPDSRPTYIMDYVVLLDHLVNTGRDVEILSESGIIINRMGDNQQAADFINRLNQFVLLFQTDYFIHANTFNGINAHYKRRWNQEKAAWIRARAVLYRDYFSSCWAYISFVAALILLLLTIAQTVFSAIQLK